MKKVLLCMFTAVGFYTASQAQVMDDKIVLLESERPVLRLEVNNNSKVVNTALLERLSENGLKAKSSKGVITITGSKIIEISPDLLDYYFKVTALDKKRTVIHLGVSKGYTNFIDGTSEPVLWGNAKAYLAGFIPYFENYMLKQDAKELEKNLKSAQKTVDKAEKDLKKQEEALEKSRKQLEENKKDLDSKKGEFEKLQRAIKK